MHIPYKVDEESQRLVIRAVTEIEDDQSRAKVASVSEGQTVRTEYRSRVHKSFLELR
jgi:hypothetical protein